MFSRPPKSPGPFPPEQMLALKKRLSTRLVLDYSECLTIGRCLNLLWQHQSLYCLGLVAYPRGLVQGGLQCGHCAIPEEGGPSGVWHQLHTVMSIQFQKQSVSAGTGCVALCIRCVLSFCIMCLYALKHTCTHTMHTHTHQAHLCIWDVFHWWGVVFDWLVWYIACLPRVSFSECSVCVMRLSCLQFFHFLSHAMHVFHVWSLLPILSTVGGKQRCCL